MSRQYVVCKFRPEDKKTYTYVNDGDPVAVENRVEIANRSGDGRQVIHVVGIVHDKPSFDCKPILGLAPPPKDDLFRDADEDVQSLIERDRE